MLNAHHVDYMVVGGHAMAVHGVPRYTKDLDIWIERTPENAARVLAALVEFGFSDLGITTNDLIAPDTVIQLGYEPNRIDLLTDISGVRFEDARAEALSVEISGVMIRAIGKRQLQENKRASARPRDLIDAQELESK